MNRLLVKAPPEYESQRRYILDEVLTRRLGLTWQLQSVPGDRVTIENSSLTGIISCPDSFFAIPARKWLKSQSLPKLPVRWWDVPQFLNMPMTSRRIPIVFGHGEYQYADGREIYLPVDIFGTAFFMLTRYEELVDGERDEHGRFPSGRATAVRGGFIDRPVVDEYVEVLRHAIQAMWPELVLKRKEPSLIMSHDVDLPFSVHGERLLVVLKRAVGDIVIRHSMSVFAKRALSIMLPGKLGERYDPTNTFGWLMDQCEHYGVHAEFNFMAARVRTKYDNGYDVSAPRIMRLMKEVETRGHRIGIHPSYYTFNNEHALNEELQRLRVAMEIAGLHQTVKSGRQHYLRWDARSTWAMWDRAGLEVDSSVGFPDVAGFRCGTGIRYRAWDWASNRPLSLLEQPLQGMDNSGSARMHLRSALIDAATPWERLRSCGGSLTLLWHNDYVATGRAKKEFLEIMRRSWR